MDFHRRDNGGAGCGSCPFSEPGKGAASNPVYQNPPSRDDADCFTKTGDAFISSFDAAASKANITADSCEALAAVGDGGQVFYALYELDKTYCGLGRESPTGDDPTVAIILADCRKYGMADLVDPGWPPSTYQCTLCAPTEQRQAATSSSETSSTSMTTPTAIQAEAAASSALSSSEEASSSSTSAIPTVSSTSSASSTAPSQASNTTTTTDPYLISSSSNNVNDQIPTQGIVAIVVCVTLAISASLTLLFCVLRRRRKQQEAIYAGGMSSGRNSRHLANSPGSGRGGGGGGDNTYEPLISPRHSLTGDHDQRPPLTPPPRLRDRKLLIPSLLRPLSRSDESLALGTPRSHHHYHQDSAGSSLYSPAQSLSAKCDVPLPLVTPVGRRDSSPFPSSPICAPRANKLEPRPERMQAFHINTHKITKEVLAPPLSPPPYHPTTRLRSPPPVSFTFPPRSSFDNNNICRSPPPPSIAASLKKKGRHRRGTATAASSYGSKAFSTSTATTTASSSSAALCGLPHPFLHHHDRTNSPSAPPAADNDPRALLFSSPTPPPLRPPRPHDEPLEIPDLVRPASPRLIGIARTTMSGDGAGGEGSISLQTLAEGHGQMQEERRRDSWGSWEGGGGGGGGGGARMDEDEVEDGEKWVGGRMFGVAFPPGHG